MEIQKELKSLGYFITFEGTEGSGKSTLLRVLAERLGSLNSFVLQTREPGGTLFAEKLRDLILHTDMSALTELLLYEASRAEHLSTLIYPALKLGKIVLCDRFTDSTLAYQSYARGISWEKVKALNALVTEGLNPDLVIFLDIPPKIGLNRAQNPNRFEKEGIDFQEKVRCGYLKARSEDPNRWLTLKALNNTPDELADAVINYLFEKKILKKNES